MSTGILFFAGGQLLSTAVFTLIGLIAVWKLKRALAGEIVAKSIKYTAIEAYQRFVAERARILQATRKICLIILGIALPLAFLTGIFDLILFPDSGGFSIRYNPSTILLPVLSICIGCYVGIYVHDLIRAVIVDTEALRTFQINNLSRDTILKQKLRSAIVTFLPVLCYLEALALIILINNNVLPALMPLLFLFVALIVIYNVFALRFYALKSPLQPIEQTQWASLVPRIQRWARLAGIEFASIQLQQDLVGTSIASVIGIGQPTLILSETLLRYTDWRQQDAMIGIAIGLAQKRIFLVNFVRKLLVNIVALAFIAFLPFTASLVGSGFTILSIALVVSILLKVANIVVTRYLRSAYFDVDRIASLLTGDPIAVMVLLNTMNSLNGVTTTQDSKLVPSTHERMRQLEILLHQPWPQAPQASMPVPSITAVGFGQRYLTMPLDQATEPAPLQVMSYSSLA